MNTVVGTPSRGWWLVLAVLLLGAGVLAMLRQRAPGAVTLESVSTACQRDYAAARTAADSLAIDGRVWQLDHRWVRIPSCGELRRRSP